MQIRSVVRTPVRSQVRHPLHGAPVAGIPGRPDMVGLFLKDSTGSLVDTIGQSSGPVQPGRGYTLSAGDWVSVPHLTGAETVESHGGTASLQVWAGQIAFGEGTCWDIVLSDGSVFPCTEGSGETMLNISDPSKSGKLSNPAVHTEFYDGISGFDMNIAGFSARENLAKNSENLLGAGWYYLAGTTKELDGDGYWEVTPPEGYWVAESRITGLDPGEKYTVKVVLKSIDAPERTIVDVLNSGYASIASSEFQNFPSQNLPSAITVDFTAPADGKVNPRVAKGLSAIGRKIKSIFVRKAIGNGIYANGDSTCQGSFGPVAISEYTAHSNFLAEALQCALVNHSTGGETLEQIYAEMQTDLASEFYPIITIGGAYNNIIGQASSPVDAMMVTAASIIDLGVLSCEKFVFTSVNAFSFQGDERLWALDYNSRLSALCDTKGVVFVDISDDLSADGENIPEMYSLDVYHYNEFAAQAIAEHILSAIGSIPADLPRYDYVETGDYQITGYQPAASASVDAIGESLEYPGRIKYNLEIVSGTGPSDWVVKLPQAPELIATLGLDTIYYDAIGTPLPIAFTSLMAQEGPLTFGSEERECWAIYSPALTGNDLARANKYFNVGS